MSKDQYDELPVDEAVDSDAMSEDQLCAIIDRMSQQAIGANDLTEEQRSESYYYYNGEAKGLLAPSEIPGSSSVVSKVLMDTVEWAMPAIMDVLAGADDIIRFEPDGPEDDDACSDATNYIGYLIHRKNEDGFTTIHDAVKSALICRMGVGKCYVEKSQDYREECYEGMTEEQVTLLQDDPEIELVDVQPFGAANIPPTAQNPAGEVVPLFRVKAKRSEEVNVFRNEGVPPEEIRIDKDTRVINDCKFIEHKREVTISYLLEQGYDEELVENLSSDGNRRYGNMDEEARTDYDDSDPEGDTSSDQSTRLVWLSESYLKVDFDGDGKTEYRRVVKANNVIFENEVVDDHPFWLLTPLLMPYKIIGMSFYDLVNDLQRIHTSLTREMLDNTYLHNRPRTEVQRSQIIDIDELLNPRVGGIVQVKQPGAIREIVTPFVGNEILQVIASVDATRDMRTGVTEMNSAVNAESFAQSNIGSAGVQAMMNAGAQRLRLIIRVLAETGFKRMYGLMLKNVTQYQDRQQQVKINNKWLTVDPREWKNKYNMIVSVGAGTAGRQQQIANLGMIGQLQKDGMPLGIASPTNFYETAKRVAEAMGYRDSASLFTQPNPNPPPQQPAMDPTAMALIEAEKIKASAGLQKAEKDNATKLQQTQMQIESTERVAMFEANERIKLQREKVFDSQAQEINRLKMQLTQQNSVMIPTV